MSGKTDADLYKILEFFEYDHLPEDLQKISKPFGVLAKMIAQNSPPGPEVSAGLRKLLEAKDCTVRANLERKPT